MKRNKDSASGSRKKEQIDVNELRKSNLEVPVPFKGLDVTHVVARNDATLLNGDVIPKSWIVTCYSCNAGLNKKSRCRGWMEESGWGWMQYPNMTCKRYSFDKEGSDEPEHVYICKECQQEAPCCPNCEMCYYEHINESKYTYDVVVAEMKNDKRIVVGCHDCIYEHGNGNFEIIAVRERPIKKKEQEEEEKGVCAECGCTFNYATEGVKSPFHRKPIHKKCSVPCVGCSNQMLTYYQAGEFMCLDGSYTFLGDQESGECNMCETPQCSSCGIAVGKNGLYCSRDGDDEYVCSCCK